MKFTRDPRTDALVRVDGPVVYCPYGSNVSVRRLMEYTNANGLRSAQRQDRGAFLIENMRLAFVLESPIWSNHPGDEWPTAGATILPADKQSVLSRAYEYSMREFLTIAGVESSAALDAAMSVDIQGLIEAGAEGVRVFDGIYGQIQYTGPVNIATPGGPEHLVPGVTFRTPYLEREIRPNKAKWSLAEWSQTPYRLAGHPCIPYYAPPNKWYAGTIASAIVDSWGPQLKGYDHSLLPAAESDGLTPVARYLLGAKEVVRNLDAFYGRSPGEFYDEFKDLTAEQCLRHQVPDADRKAYFDGQLHPAAYIHELWQRSAGIPNPTLPNRTVRFNPDVIVATSASLGVDALTPS